MNPRKIPIEANDILLEEEDPRIVDWAERRIIRRLGPLSPYTTPEQWDAYWQAVADEVRGTYNR